VQVVALRASAVNSNVRPVATSQSAAQANLLNVTTNKQSHGALDIWKGRVQGPFSRGDLPSVSDIVGLSGAVRSIPPPYHSFLHHQNELPPSTGREQCKKYELGKSVWYTFLWRLSLAAMTGAQKSRARLVHTSCSVPSGSWVKCWWLLTKVGIVGGDDLQEFNELGWAWCWIQRKIRRFGVVDLWSCFLLLLVYVSNLGAYRRGGWRQEYCLRSIAGVL